MIKGFIQETKPLSKDELNIVSIIVHGLSTFPPGKQFKKTASFFLERLETLNIVITDIRFRKIIQYIRMNDLVLGVCSDNRGYWIADNATELRDTLISLKDRIINQTATFNALTRQYKKLYEGKIKENKDLY